MRRILIVVLSLLLCACVRDSATYYINGNSYAVTLRAEQAYFWDEELQLTVMASRLPECQRRFALATVPLDAVKVSVFALGEQELLLRLGKQQWRLDTFNCTLADGAKVEAGEPLGVFHLQDEKMEFVPAPQRPAPTAEAASN